MLPDNPQFQTGTQSQHEHADKRLIAKLREIFLSPHLFESLGNQKEKNNNNNKRHLGADGQSEKSGVSPVPLARPVAARSNVHRLPFSCHTKKTPVTLRQKPLGDKRCVLTFCLCCKKQ